MYRHADANYVCPFCALIQGKTETLSVQEDIVYQTEFVSAFIASHWWPNNAGHVLIIPNEHIENLYEIPFEMGAYLIEAARKVALAMKVAYACEGISTRQHNEPAGYQDVFHYHMHVFPRYTHDYLYDLSAWKQFAEPAKRKPYAEALRAVI